MIAFRRSLAAAFASLVAACGGIANTELHEPDGGERDGGTSSLIDAAPNDAADSDAKDSRCSPSTNAGDSCAQEGAYCKPSPCTDECQFCNSLHCSAGKWETMEAFPMPQAYCAEIQCGTLACGKGEFCVRTHSSPPMPPPSFACAKFPPGCFDCACLGATACSGMAQTKCEEDPATQKPIVDCSSL